MSRPGGHARPCWAYEGPRSYAAGAGFSWTGRGGEPSCRPDNRQIADALCRNALDHWAGVLDGGAAGRAEVVLAFSENRERAAPIAGGIQSEEPGEFGILFA